MRHKARMRGWRVTEEGRQAGRRQAVRQADLTGEDVIGDHHHVLVVTESLAQGQEQRCLATPHGAPNAHCEGSLVEAAPKTLGRVTLAEVA